MTTVRVQSAGVVGIDAYSVDIDVNVEAGPASFKINGMSLNAAKEAGVRIRCALQHAGFVFPARKIEINISPGDVSGVCAAAFDLPIAVGIVKALGAFARAADGLVLKRNLYTANVILLGEMSLDGRLRKIAGALPIALHAKACGANAVILPRENAGEINLENVLVYGAESLTQVIAHLRLDELDEDTGISSPMNHDKLVEVSWRRVVGQVASAPKEGVDMSEIRGLEVARRAMEIAAAGGHNLLLIGPPGSGKAMLACRLPTIMPPMDEGEAQALNVVYSAAGRLNGAPLVDRPFRAPHHDVSVAGLVGGGPTSRPGEVTLAQHGVLFLDELPEFKRSALEALRPVLDDRSVTIVRSRAALTYPANFLLVAAMQPCPCGYYGSSLRTCTCGTDRIKRFRERIGPMTDRSLSMQIEVPHVDYWALRSDRDGECSADIRARVIVAREVQKKRGPGLNANMGPRQLALCCRLDDMADRHLDACVRRFALSGRAVHAILRVARTIADLAGRERLASSDVAEAIALRALDR